MPVFLCEVLRHLKNDRVVAGLNIYNAMQVTALNRVRATLIHFSCSVALAFLVALLVFGLWYPYPYREISGGRELFLLVVTVDVILGPLITFVIFNINKSSSELLRDLGIVVLFQLAALAYGVWTVAMARPVHMVFEVDRFRIVHAIEIPEDLIRLTPTGVTALPLTGPTLLSLRPFNDNREETDATIAALQGVSLSSRPDLWQTYDVSRQSVLRASKTVTELKQRFPSQVDAINSALANHAEIANTVVYIPLVGRNAFWTVLLDGGNANVLGYLPLDSF